MIGSTVCRMHGGAAPQVRQAARERIAAAADPAVTELIRLMKHGKQEAVRRMAASDLLDRAGYEATHKSEIEHKGEIRRDPDLSRLTLEQLRVLKTIADQANGITNGHNAISGELPEFGFGRSGN